jgi:hypothetical protein
MAVGWEGKGRPGITNGYVLIIQYIYGSSHYLQNPVLLHRTAADILHTGTI